MKKLNLGSGANYKKGWINVDIDKRTKADKHFDLNKKWNIKDNSVDEILAKQLIEHNINLLHFCRELGRVLKTSGKYTITTPNPYFWRCRINYLLGNFSEGSVWQINHTLLVKPSLIKELLKQNNLTARIEGRGLLPFPNLFYYNIIIKGKRRDE